MSMTDREFGYMSTFLLKSSGIVVPKDKMYLLRSRLQPLLRKHKIESLDSLAKAVRSNEMGALAHEVVDAMTTNETLFFRDQYPYEALKTLVFPEIVHSKGVGKGINIWSAASSRGQEAISIMLTALESVPQADRRIHILGTDLSDEALAYATAALYTQMEVQRGMPVKMLVRFFNQEGSNWRIRPELQVMMKFKKGNLVSDQLAGTVRGHGPFDVVFLRNVLIYFTVEERKRVIDRIAANMIKGGYLITGATEVAQGVRSQWEMVSFKNKRLWKLL
ncbi:MAG: protein-glutamate O-methyltransferase CheR [Mariprofundales bacterium]|nr:protein-glutamate O-methyltransferase CheR [Mariprofundales bacterium]